MLIAACTAPYYSWTNPAERIMSILNLSLQNVSLQRNSMSSSSEETFTSLKTLEDIRNEVTKLPSLKKELQKSISNIQTLLNIRTEYLKLHDNYFITKSPATDLEIDELFDVNINKFIILFKLL
jgi:hypothetical protein